MATLFKATLECNIKICQLMQMIEVFRKPLKQIKWNIPLRIALKKKLQSKMIIRYLDNLKITYKGSK